MTSTGPFMCRTGLGLIVLAACLATGNAATVPTETPLRLRAELSAPAVATLAAGATVAPLTRDALAAEGIATLPAGWIAVHYSGPVTGYALNSTVGKDFMLKPGAMIRAAPASDAQMFSIVGENDRAEVLELAGDWSKVVFDKSMVLFMKIGDQMPPAVADNPPPAPAPAASASSQPQPSVAPSPPPPPASVSSTADSTPRVFQGYLTRTRRILGAGPKLDYQIVDAYNKRIALLDLSALLLTDPIDRLEERYVSVFGIPMQREGVKDVVIRVETIRLLQ